MDDEAAVHTRTTFDAASDHFDDDALSFFVRIGRRTADHARIAPGDLVLDVACGSGSSALPAAEMAGPGGGVLGVDLSEGLLARARAKAAAAALTNAEFRLGDMRELDVLAESFDAVVCVFGVFFVPDMDAVTRDLWRRVRPGGCMLLTVWAPGFMEPAHSAFWDEVQRERPDLVTGPPRWMRLADPAGLRAMVEGAGIPADAIEILTEPGMHPLPDPEDFWTIVLGTGMRGPVDVLEPDAVARVRAHVVDVIREGGVTELPVDVHYARATKPG